MMAGWRLPTPERIRISEQPPLKKYRLCMTMTVQNLSSALPVLLMFATMPVRSGSIITTTDY